ncbi:MAG TPA: NAD(P)/FAD-dependent oxidoreductase [Kofleriaceae bacterium]|nr:NAD(P)/FAD-dependent oxidoreductase [Kofleriaceae bacterium]
MPRSPLLRSIQALARDAHAAKVTGIPTTDLRDLREQHRLRNASAGSPLSRRRFLAGAAAGAAALALPGRAHARPGQPKITIVGGGIAGLTCALTLRDRGLDSTVYEASGRVGGRMFSNTGYFAAGQVSEWCGELIDTGHHTVRNLAARFSLPLDDLHAAEPNGSTETYLFDGQYYPKAQADADFAELVDALRADLDAAPFPTTFDAFTPEALALDHLSVRGWIESRVPGGFGSPLGQLLDAAYNIEYGAETTVQSSLNLLYLLGFQPTATQLDLFGESDERFHIRGGNQRLPEAIAQGLGDAVVTGHRMVRLERTPNGRYRTTFERAGSSIEVVSDLVVLALPFAVLDGVDLRNAGFEPRKQRAIAQLGRGHNGKLNLQFERRGWLGEGPWPGKANGSSYGDTGYQASWDVTRAQPGTPGILVLYSGGNVTDAMRSTSPFATASDPKVLQDVERGLAQIAPVFPGLAWNGRAAESLPHKSPFFGLAYSYWKVGQYTDFGGFEGAPQGGVHFCGEHTSQEFQGFMEGGASTGEQTAKDLIALIK